MGFGTTHHLTNDDATLNYWKYYFISSYVIIGNGDSIGTACHSSISTSHNTHIFLKIVLHTPNVLHNLVYFHKLCKDNNALVEFHAYSFCVK